MTDKLVSTDGLPRCFGNCLDQDFLAYYYDTEWGVPVHDDRHLFEMLTLEGAQAGLSWNVVLRKRADYKAASHNFDLSRSPPLLMQTSRRFARMQGSSATG